MKIALLQSDNLPYDKAKLNFFIRVAKSEGAKLIVLPEYVLNRFFKEIEVTPISFVKKQSLQQIKHLKHLSIVYNISILAPLVKIVGDKKYKVLIKVENGHLRYYYQQIFMPYSHWNENKFFDTKENFPLIFSLDGVKFGAMFGFEAHIEKFWNYFKRKKVDCVLIPSVSTFNSHNRWLEMLKTKAFLNHMYVVRVNRVGSYKDWVFYGRSFAISPEGEILNMLSNKEEIGIINIEKEKVKEARKEWKFIELEKLIKHF